MNHYESLYVAGVFLWNQHLSCFFVSRHHRVPRPVRGYRPWRWCEPWATQSWPPSKFADCWCLAAWCPADGDGDQPHRANWANHDVSQGKQNASQDGRRKNIEDLNPTMSSHESNALIFQCKRTHWKSRQQQAQQVSGVVEMMILGSPWKQCSRTSAEEKSPE